LAVNACTFHGNEARGGGGAAISDAYMGTNGSGGALYSAGVLTATNVTLVGNRALGGNGGLSAFGSLSPGGPGQGGGVSVDAGTATLAHGSLVDNLAQGGLLGGYPDRPRSAAEGGGISAPGGALTVINSLIAHSLSGSNCFGNVIDGGHNISDDASCPFYDHGGLNNTDPVIGPLANYGGPTPTVPLLAGSPAIDAADNAASPPTDQRGHARPFGTASDVGAFESSPPYTVRGYVRGFRIPAGLTVSAGTNNASTDPNGEYVLLGLEAGSHTVTPSDPNIVFVPRQRSVSVGPDQLGINFAAYRTNSLSIEKTNGTIHLVFAGAAGERWRIQVTTNLSTWTDVATNSTDSDGLFHSYQAIAPDQSAHTFRTAKP